MQMNEQNEIISVNSDLKKPTRSSNIELLRIIMMISLIAHHMVVNSGINVYQVENVFRKTIYMQLFGMWGKTAINVFTIITGYFMINKSLKVKKLLRIILEMYFYVLCYYIIFVIIHYQPFSFIVLIKTVLFVPYDMGRYYAGSMVMMFLFIPLINKMVESFNKTQYGIMIILLLFYYTVLSSIKFNDNFDFVIWLITVYLIGGYIRLYSLRIDNVICGMIGTLLSIVLMSSSIIMIDKMGARFGFCDPSFFISDANKVLALMASVFLFVLFKNIKIKDNRIINVVASTTFGILLIHSCSAYIRNLLWFDLFDISGHYNKGNIYLYSLLVVILIFVISMLIDILRQLLIEKPFFDWLNKFSWVNKNLWF